MLGPRDCGYRRSRYPGLMDGGGRDAVEYAGRNDHAGIVGSDGQFERLAAGALEVLDPDRMKPGFQGDAPVDRRAGVNTVVVDNPGIMHI